MLGTTSFLLMKTRLPPKPPGPFFYFQAFKVLPYAAIAASFFVSKVAWSGHRGRDADCQCWAFGYFAFLFFIGTYGNLLGLGTFAPYLLWVIVICAVF
jgi:hypothetical protein